MIQASTFKEKRLKSAWIARQPAYLINNPAFDILTLNMSIMFIPKINLTVQIPVTGLG